MNLQSTSPFVAVVGIGLVAACSATGFLRYGLPRMRLGDLEEGDPAIEIALVTLDGRRTDLGSHLGDRPLVLIFGSFT